MTSQDQPGQQPETVTIHIRSTGVPARDLPLGMRYDVLQVLRAHGLDVQDPSEHAEVLISLARIVDVVAVDRGGRRP